MEPERVMQDAECGMHDLREGFEAGGCLNMRCFELKVDLRRLSTTKLPHDD